MMPTKVTYWPLLIQWILLSLAGWALVGLVPVGFVLYTSSVVVFPRYNLGTMLLSEGLGWIIGGIVIGIGQWLLLRRYLNKMDWWPIVSIIAWVVIGTIDVIAMGMAGRYLIGRIMIWAISGAFFGIVQWLVMCWTMKKTGFWILVNILGWTIGGVVSELMSGAWSILIHLFFGDTVDAIFRGSAGLLNTAAGNILEGIIIGALTSGVLIWLININKFEKTILVD